MVDTVRTEKDIKIALHSFTVLLDYNDITDIRNFELPSTAEGSTNSVTLQTNKGNAKLTLNWLTKGEQLGDLEMVLTGPDAMHKCFINMSTTFLSSQLAGFVMKFTDSANW